MVLQANAKKKGLKRAYLRSNNIKWYSHEIEISFKKLIENDISIYGTGYLNIILIIHYNDTCTVCPTYMILMYKKNHS
jgi:hypothetical protein